MPEHLEKRTELSAKTLIREAGRQSEALRTISKWRALAMAVAANGAVLIYGGAVHVSMRVPLLVSGVLLMAIGLAAAILCDMGIRNGRKNVEKILDAADRRN